MADFVCPNIYWFFTDVLEGLPKWMRCPLSHFQGWLTTELQNLSQHLLTVIIFLGPLFFFPLANSKSEGSPVLPHEPSKVKPEESREITRPSRPAVSAFLSNSFELF